MWARQKQMDGPNTLEAKGLKKKRTLSDGADSLRESVRSMGRIFNPPTGPTWRWEELPGRGAGLFSNEGDLLLVCEYMPKAEVARVIAAAPDLNKEKFGILFDRRYFQTDAPRRLAHSDDTKAALLFFDLDNFKPVNDRLGHPAGDDVLRIYFHTVASEVGGVGQAYGWGGDEVVVLLPGSEQATAETVRNRIVASVTQKCSAHPQVAEAGMVVGVSGGIYVFEDTEPLDEIIRKADAAMYEVKETRRRGKKGRDDQV